MLDRERGKWCSQVREINDFKSLKKKNSIEWDDPFRGYQSASILRKPNKLMNKVATVAGTEVIHGLNNTDFSSPK